MVFESIGLIVREGIDMKAISIRQPWAWLISKGHKKIENRNWRYEPKLRGRIAIHAAKGCTRREYEEVVEFVRSVDESITIPPLSDLARGKVVATCNLVSVVRYSPDPWFFGPIGFVLDSIEEVTPVIVKGRLGFFEIDESKGIES